MPISKEDDKSSWEQCHIILLSHIVMYWIWSFLDSDETLVVTRVSPPIFGLKHCCHFRKRMQLNMGGRRLSHAHIKRRWQEFVGAISHNTSFTHCPVLNLILAWFGWKRGGNKSLSTNLWLTTLLSLSQTNATKHGWPSIKHLVSLLPFPSTSSFLPFLFLQFLFLLQFIFLLSYFLLQPMLILTGLSLCHKFQLYFTSLMPQIKGTYIKIECFKIKPCPSQKKMTRVCGGNIT